MKTTWHTPGAPKGRMCTRCGKPLNQPGCNLPPEKTNIECYACDDKDKRRGELPDRAHLCGPCRTTIEDLTALGIDPYARVMDLTFPEMRAILAKHDPRACGCDPEQDVLCTEHAERACKP